jgi:hypothetical protein
VDFDQGASIVGSDEGISIVGSDKEYELVSGMRHGSERSGQ